MNSHALHKFAVDCGWATACFVGVAAASVTQADLQWFTLWAMAIVAAWRGLLVFLEFLGIQYPRRPIWTWGRRTPPGA